jgi:hypothetical protein
VAEGGGLLNRYTLQRRIEGSNPCVSARFSGSESLHPTDCPEINPLNVRSGPAGGGPVVRSGGSLPHLTEAWTPNSSPG